MSNITSNNVVGEGGVTPSNTILANLDKNWILTDFKNCVDSWYRVAQANNLGADVPLIGNYSSTISTSLISLADQIQNYTKIAVFNPIKLNNTYFKDNNLYIPATKRITWDNLNQIKFLLDDLDTLANYLLSLNLFNFTADNLLNLSSRLRVQNEMLLRFIFVENPDYGQINVDTARSNVLIGYYNLKVFV